MRLKNLILLGIFALSSLAAVPGMAHSASGLPSSPQFGYGASVDLDGQQTSRSLLAAALLGLDWVAVDFDWARLWSDPNIAPNISGLDQVMINAQQNRLNVLISITNPSPWVLTSSGPDPNVTANLVVYLARLYPETLMAIEIFPGANTTRGWGAQPNPLAYLSLLNTAKSALEADNRPITLVAAGLTPLPSGNLNENMDDLAFLTSLYDAGAAPLMPIVSMRLPELTGDPIDAPTQEEHRCLRHYEEIRQIMLKYNQQNGLIWLTSFSWPTGTISSNEGLSPEAQALWVKKAYRQLKSQLYLGAAFFRQLNPPDASEGAVPSLIESDLEIHPAFRQLSSVIFPNGRTTFEFTLTKRIVQTINLKPDQP